MSTMPDTIIEIYDDEQIYNVLSACEWKPENLVFIGTRKLKNKKVKNNIINCLRNMGLDTRCFFYSADMHSLDAVKRELVTILDTFGECAVDITGGNEVALVAVGMLSAERNLRIFKYDRYSEAYRNIAGCEAADNRRAEPSFNINALLSLSGGIMKSHGHVAVAELDKETLDDIFAVWTIYKNNNRAWHRAVSYLQQISKNLEEGELSVRGKSVLYGGERMIGEEKEIMTALAARGIIRNYSSDGGKVSFTFKSKFMRSCLIDIGVCLELYVYAAAKSMGCFGDVEISVVIDWDGDLAPKINTINEIDVVAVSGFVPLFISCKSGTPNVTALNEIKTLAKQFGGRYAKPVLVTMADVRTKDKYLYVRAKDMGVELIDRNDLIGERLSKRLYSLTKS